MRFFQTDENHRLAPIPEGGEEAFYCEEGYLVVEAGIPEALLERVAAETRDRYEHWRPNSGIFHPDRQQDAWKYSPAARALATHPSLLELLGKLYGRRPLPFQTLNFPVGTQQPAHSDTIHFNCEPGGFMCGVWTALEDIDLANGPLEFYPGSHLLPEFDYEDIGLEPGMENYPRYESFIQGVIRGRGCTSRYAVMPRGYSLLWAANLLHGGSFQKNKTRTRQSQVTHYFFENSERYFTPLLGTRASPFLRQREWIPAE